MTDNQVVAIAKRDRSPSFPYIGLAKALERIEILYAKAKVHEVRVSDIAVDWGIAPKSSATDRNVAALLSYGLIEDNGTGETRKIKISDIGRRILDDKRAGVREKLLCEVAVKPRLLSEYAERWRGGRPDTAHALSDLKFDGGFTEEGARMFLRVFDETIGFTKPLESAKVDDSSLLNGIHHVENHNMNEADITAHNELVRPPSSAGVLHRERITESLGADEREWLRGPLSKETGYRLIVSGDLGPKEIGKLIKLLEAQKAVLSDDD